MDSDTRFRVTSKIAFPSIVHYISILWKRKMQQHRLQAFQKLQLYKQLKCEKILQATGISPTTHIAETNGFMKTVLHCYNRHKNLVLRPDDIWIAIMTQFSYYVNKNSEELRNKFVDFKGKETLIVDMGVCEEVDGEIFVKTVTKLMDLNLTDVSAKSWILPSFSTTTENDVVTTGIIFMATMKKYFDYEAWHTLCGIPEIILKGTLADWKGIYSRLDKLNQYAGLGEWTEELKNILSHFVLAKQGNPEIDFWGTICDLDYYSGSWQSGDEAKTFLTGWITTFCAIDEDGIYRDHKKLEIRNIQSGYVEVPFVIKETTTGNLTKSVMFAGHIGMETLEHGTTARPSVGWAIAKQKE